jgi:hypothetical protein
MSYTHRTNDIIIYFFLTLSLHKTEATPRIKATGTMGDQF